MENLDSIIDRKVSVDSLVIPYVHAEMTVMIMYDIL